MQPGADKEAAFERLSRHSGGARDGGELESIDFETALRRLFERISGKPEKRRRKPPLIQTQVPGCEVRA